MKAEGPVDAVRRGLFVRKDGIEKAEKKAPKPRREAKHCKGGGGQVAARARARPRSTCHPDSSRRQRWRLSAFDYQSDRCCAKTQAPLIPKNSSVKLIE